MTWLAIIGGVLLLVAIFMVWLENRQLRGQLNELRQFHWETIEAAALERENEDVERDKRIKAEEIDRIESADSDGSNGPDRDDPRYFD
jgi:hypothetical protein